MPERSSVAVAIRGRARQRWRATPIAGKAPDVKTVLVWVGLHLMVVLAMRAVPAVATLHAIATVVGALVWSRMGQIPVRIAMSCAYIAGAEVLWRMTKAGVFWEYGKYASVVVAGAGLLASSRAMRTRTGQLLVLYFALLLPSVLLTVEQLGFTRETREGISFNLSGPLALLILGLLLAGWSPRHTDLVNVMWAVAVPASGIAFLALAGILTAGEIEFGSASSFAASGGFGPNQVSGVLGLGALAMVLVSVLDRRSHVRVVAGLLGLWFLAQSLLTFSRGGTFSLAVALAVFFAHGVRSRRWRRVLLGGVVLSAVLMATVLLPRLERFTEGALSQRYTDLNTTGRVELAQGDIRLWLAHPVLGVGPGMAAERRVVGRRVAPHTEVTRLLAEHGMIGLGALILLMLIARSAYRRAPAGFERAWVAAMVAWPLAEMGHAAMRIVAVSFVFGLALVRWDAFEQRSGMPRLFQLHGRDR